MSEEVAWLMAGTNVGSMLWPVTSLTSLQVTLQRNRTCKCARTYIHTHKTAERNRFVGPYLMNFS
jgi:hypothetical protein